MSKQSISRAASSYPVYTYSTLDKWADVEYHRNAKGEWLPVVSGFNPLRDYIQEIEHILCTGKIGNHDTLCDLRTDLIRLDADFNRKNFDGLCSGKRWKGGKV